jgi:proline dehydrogenase
MKVDFNNTAIAFAYKSNKALIHAYTIYRLINIPHLTQWGISLADKMIQSNMKEPLVWGMKPTIFKLFCGGESLTSSEKKIQQLYKYGVKTIADYGVEAKEKEEDFITTADAIKAAILYASQNKYIPFVSSKFTGLLPFHLLEKLQIGSVLDADEHKLYNNFLSSIDTLSALAYEKGISLFVDAEESWIQDPLDSFTTTLMEKYNLEKPIVYNTIQLYRKDRLTYLKYAHQQAQQKGYIYAVKLVRGAYMEKENIRAEELGYESPIHTSKLDSDADYDAALDYVTDHIDSIAVCVATHNEESCKKMLEMMSLKKIDKEHPHVHFSQLYGMGDFISFNLAHGGYNVSKYMPYGAVKEVIPYLIRRAQENTSVAGQMTRELKLIIKEIRRRKLHIL